MTESIQLAQRPRRGGAYHAGVGVAAVTSFLTVWTTIVRDDGDGLAFFMVILAVAVGAFATALRPAGMVRTMVGVAIMQVLLGIGVATEPIVTAVPGGSVKALLFNGAFAGFWLISAACFRAAARTSDYGSSSVESP
jgi:hypothetical protein